MESGKELNSLIRAIIGCAIRVHKALGPGFLETVYQRALTVDLRSSSLAVDVEKVVPIYYRGELVGRHRLDLVVENQVIVELKTVESLSEAHYAQVRSYMGASGLPVSLLINFSASVTDFRRVDRKRAWREAVSTKKKGCTGDPALPPGSFPLTNFPPSPSDLSQEEGESRAKRINTEE